MEGGDSGKVWGIEPMVYRDSVRTLWMGSIEDNQSFMELYGGKCVAQSWKWQEDQVLERWMN